MQEYVTTKILLDEKEIIMVNPTVQIRKNTGEHTRVQVQGIVKAESYPVLEAAGTMAGIRIQTGNGEGDLFAGVVTYMDIQIRISEGKQYQELFLEAMSGTCLLDREKKNFSFQRKSAGYKEILDFVLKDYPDANYLFSGEASGKKTDCFIVQYKETDWEFLTRIASFLHLPLVACHNTKGVRFTFGTVWKNDTYAIPQEEEWQVEVIHDSLTNAGKGYRYLKWNVESTDAPIFETGDCVVYQGTRFYVKKSEIEIKDHVLKQSCHICGKQGFDVQEVENPFLTGLSLPGSVAEVKNNQLKVRLDIDAWEEQECWFVYSTFYSTFYCMPEKGDRINLYFPDHKEEHAFVLNSVRTSPQEAAHVVTGSAGNGGTYGTGQESGTVTGSQNIRQETKSIDVTPYLAMLAAPENGKIINVSAVFGSSRLETDPGSTVQGSSPAGSSKAAGKTGSGGTTGGKDAGGQNFDFQSLAANENIKVLCTKGGRMVVLDDESGAASIVCNDGTYITLTDQGITIETDQKILFNASEEMKLTAGSSLVISAEDEIEIKCQDSMFKMDPEMIKIQGTDIKINE